MISRYLLLWLACVWLLPAAADPLTLDEAVNLALAHQPLLQSQRAVVRAAEESAIAEAQLPDPRLKLGVMDTPSDSLSLSEDDFTMAPRVSLEQSFPGGDKRRLRGQKAQFQAEKSTNELDELQRVLQRDVTLAWLNLFQLLHSKTLLGEREKEYQNELQSALIEYSVNRTAQHQVLAIQNNLYLVKDRVIELDTQIVRARSELARWIGNRASEDLPDALPEVSAPAELGVLLERLIHHPQLRALDKATLAAETDVKLAREARKPDWNVEVSYGHRREFSDLISLQVAIDLPIFPGNRQDRVSSSKLAMLDQAQSLREDRLRSLTAELESSYAEWQSVGKRIAQFRTQILPDAADRVASAHIAYQTGKLDLLGVLEAHHAQVEAKLQLLALQVARIRALAQLQYFSVAE